MKLEEAVSELKKRLMSDEGYRTTWIANIAMSFKDEWSSQMGGDVVGFEAELVHKISNKAAERFLSNLCADVEK